MYPLPSFLSCQLTLLHPSRVFTSFATSFPLLIEPFYSEMMSFSFSSVSREHREEGLCTGQTHGSCTLPHHYPYHFTSLATDNFFFSKDVLLIPHSVRVFRLDYHARNIYWVDAALNRIYVSLTTTSICITSSFC